MEIDVLAAVISYIAYLKSTNEKGILPYRPILTQTKKKMPKIQNLETLPRSMHVFFGVNLLCALRGGVIRSFISSPILPYVNENEKKS